MGLKNIFTATLKHLFISLAIALFILSEEWFVGENDLMALFFIVVSAMLMYKTVLTLQVGNKKILRINTRKGSFWYRIFSGKGISPLISVVVVLIVSATMLIVVKGMALNHGLDLIIILIIVSSMVISLLLNRKKEGLEYLFIKNNAAPEIAKHAIFFSKIIMLALAFNTVLSLILTYFDVESFMNNTITLANFDQDVVEHAIVKTADNHLSRALIHIYMLMENIKMAITNMIFAHVLEVPKDTYYGLSFVVIFFFNYIKLFGFSFGFVFLQKGITELLTTLFYILEKRAREIVNSYRE